jgi:hypothetical protein
VNRKAEEWNDNLWGHGRSLEAILVDILYRGLLDLAPEAEIVTGVLDRHQVLADLALHHAADLVPRYPLVAGDLETTMA